MAKPVLKGIMKHAFYALLLLAALVAPAGLRAEPVKIDGVTAWVNGSPITVMDVLRDAQPQFAGLLREKGLSQAELNSRRMKLFRQVRRNLIETELIYAWYLKEKQKSNLSMTDQVVDDRINAIVLEEFGGSRERLMKALAEDRLTYEEWRGKMARRIIVQGMRAREVMAKIQVTPQAVRSYYEQNKAVYDHPGQVLLRRIVLTGDGAQARSQALLDRLSQGEDFEALALSPEGGAQSDGGLWGWQTEADLSKALREKLAGMKVGDVAKVDLGGDWYLVKLEGRNAVTFEEASSGIESTLRREEAQRLTDLWMSRLERDFHVKIIEQPLWDE
jgi:parvulin-like peptidyl-prolyl isomerase